MNHHHELATWIRLGHNNGFRYVVIVWDKINQEQFPIFVPQGYDPVSYVKNLSDQHQVISKIYDLPIDFPQQAQSNPIAIKSRPATISHDFNEFASNFSPDWTPESPLKQAINNGPFYFDGEHWHKLRRSTRSRMEVDRFSPI